MLISAASFEETRSTAAINAWEQRGISLSDARETWQKGTSLARKDYRERVATANYEGTTTGNNVSQQLSNADALWSADLAEENTLGQADSETPECRTSCWRRDNIALP